MIHIVVDLEMNPVEKFRRRNKPKTLSEEIIEIRKNQRVSILRSSGTFRYKADNHAVDENHK